MGHKFSRIKSSKRVQGAEKMGEKWKAIRESTMKNIRKGDRKSKEEYVNVSKQDVEEGRVLAWMGDVSGFIVKRKPGTGRASGERQCQSRCPGRGRSKPRRKATKVILPRGCGKAVINCS